MNSTEPNTNFWPDHMVSCRQCARWVSLSIARYEGWRDVQLHPDDGVHTKKGVGLCWFCDRNNRAKAMGCTVWAS